MNLNEMINTVPGTGQKFATVCVFSCPARAVLAMIASACYVQMFLTKLSSYSY